MIIHLAEGMDDAAMASARPRKDAEPRATVDRIMINRIAAIAARHDMVDRAGKFESNWSRHARYGTDGPIAEDEFAQLCAG
jgi:hypothetical protein